MLPLSPRNRGWIAPYVSAHSIAFGIPRRLEVTHRATGAPVIVTCKWEPKLIKALLALTPHVHVVLDQFDVDHRKPDWDLLRSAESVRTISSFSALEELATLAVDFMTRKVAVDRIISYGEFSQLGAGYLALLLGLRGAD